MGDDYMLGQAKDTTPYPVNAYTALYPCQVYNYSMHMISSLVFPASIRLLIVCNYVMTDDKIIAIVLT